MPGHLKILSVGTVGSAVRELIPIFEQASGCKVELSLGNPVAVLERLRHGEAADVALVAQGVWDDLLELGRVDAATLAVLGSTSYGIGVSAGAEKPDIRTAAAFRSAMLEARSIGLVDRSLSTASLMKALEDMGIAAEVGAKVRTFATGEAVAEALAHADVELGLTTMSELISVPGIGVLGPVPSDILPVTTTTVAVVTKDAQHPQAAKEFVVFLCTPAAKAILKAKGIESD
jgi:molybdate transport system substrate-binding protein